MEEYTAVTQWLIQQSIGSYIWLGTDYYPGTNNYVWFNGDPVSVPVHPNKDVTLSTNNRIVLRVFNDEFKGITTVSKSSSLLTLCEQTFH